MAKISLRLDALNKLRNHKGLTKNTRNNIKAIYRKLRIDSSDFGVKTFQNLFTDNESTLKVLQTTVNAIRKCPDLNWAATTDQFIDYDKVGSKLPVKIKDFTELSYSRFFLSVPDYEDNKKVELKCWNQRTCLRPAPLPSHYPEGALSFWGIQKNTIDNKPFILTATRASDYVFSVTGYHPEKTFSYQATFTKCFQEGDSGKVLSGTWIGMDYALRSWQFRCFLSSIDLNEELVRKYLRLHPFGFYKRNEQITWDTETVTDFDPELCQAFEKKDNTFSDVEKVWRKIYSKS